MPNLKACMTAVFMAMSLVCVGGCGEAGEGITSPPVISALGVAITPLKDGRVHLTVKPQTVSSALPNIHVRVDRGATTIFKQTLPWNYSQGAEMDLGSPELPLQEGDRVVLGTNASNTHVSLPVAP